MILISECFCSRCGHTNQHPPPTWRETTGDNTPVKLKFGPRGFLQGISGEPTPTSHMKGDNRRQRETTGDKTTSEPKKPTTPTNTKAARSKVALRTPTVNCLGKNRIWFEYLVVLFHDAAAASFFCCFHVCFGVWKNWWKKKEHVTCYINSQVPNPRLNQPCLSWRMCHQRDFHSKFQLVP